MLLWLNPPLAARPDLELLQKVERWCASIPSIGPEIIFIRGRPVADGSRCCCCRSCSDASDESCDYIY